jgi:hypothetical protein
VAAPSDFPFFGGAIKTISAPQPAWKGTEPSKRFGLRDPWWTGPRGGRAGEVAFASGHGYLTPISRTLRTFSAFHPGLAPLYPCGVVPWPEYYPTLGVGFP